MSLWNMLFNCLGFAAVCQGCRFSHVLFRSSIAGNSVRGREWIYRCGELQWGHISWIRGQFAVGRKWRKDNGRYVLLSRLADGLVAIDAGFCRNRCRWDRCREGDARLLLKSGSEVPRAWSLLKLISFHVVMDNKKWPESVKEKVLAPG